MESLSSEVNTTPQDTSPPSRGMESTRIAELQVLLHVQKETLINFLEEDVSCSSMTSEYSTSDNNVVWILECLLNARFEEIFRNEDVRSILRGTTESSRTSSVTENLRRYIEQSTVSEDSHFRHLFVQFIGIAALQFFVQLNWIGPVTDTNPSLLLSDVIDVSEKCMDCLSLCGLPVYTQIQCPELLLLSKFVLHDLELRTLTKAWWKLRYYSVNQVVLEDKNSELYSRTIQLVNEAMEIPICVNKDVENQLRIEAALICMRFHDISKAKEYLKRTQEDSGMTLKLSGALAKRTQFQTIPYSQLYLQVSKEKGQSISLYTHNCELPVDVKLDDDTLLNNVKFLELDPNESVRLLRAEDQSIILAVSALHQRQSANDSMLEEELSAYANSILSNPQNFCVQFCALLLRSKLDKQNSKKVERSMMQLQALLDQKKKTSDTSYNRFQLFYSTPIPPSWVLEKELANILLALGSIKSALDIFLRLHMWEETVFCYKSLQRNDKALQIIEAELQKGKTPLLLCLKGDVTDEPSWYEEAWELSNHHSARAKRSLGYFYFQRKEYKECIPHLLESVEIDSLEHRAWFYLGHAATQIENYELAAKCYRHLVGLDQDSFEAWNNLSNAYIRLNDKLRAWRTLQEAIKCNYEQWKVWENYLLVSVDVGAFDDVINSWHRLIDIKGKHVDDEVLSILVRAVVENLDDINGQPSSNLLEKVLKLMGHITATDTTSSKTWACYATLLEHKVTKTEDVILLERVIQYYQKSLNIIKNEMQKNLNHRSLEHCKALFEYTSTLADTCIKYCVSGKNEVQAKQQLHSAKLVIRNNTVLVKKAAEHFTQSDINDVITPGVKELDSKMDTILSMLK